MLNSLLKVLFKTEKNSMKFYLSWNSTSCHYRNSILTLWWRSSKQSSTTFINRYGKPSYSTVSLFNGKHALLRTQLSTSGFSHHQSKYPLMGANGAFCMQIPTARVRKWKWFIVHAARCTWVSRVSGALDPKVLAEPGVERGPSPLG